MEGGNYMVMIGLPNFHLLPGVRLETLYVSGQQYQKLILVPISIANLLKLLSQLGFGRHSCVEVELVACGEEQGYLHNLAESCDHISPLLQGGSGDQVEGGNNVMLGLPNFPLLPGVRLETLYVGG